MFWLLLVVAGNETTRNAVSGSVLALHEHGLWAWLADHPEHDATAIEELLRYVSPVHQFRRTATRDLELGDQQVRAGDKVVIWFGAANRDPDVFADPHRLDLQRDPNPHVAFGVGPHFCLGAHLARLEMSAMLRHLLDAVARPDGDRRADPRRLELHQRGGPPAGANMRPMAKREKPQQIADEIRRLIIQGDLVEGELLGHEPELIERFGVSRPSLREALRILEAEG